MRKKILLAREGVRCSREQLRPQGAQVAPAGLKQWLGHVVEGVPFQAVGFVGFHVLRFAFVQFGFHPDGDVMLIVVGHDVIGGNKVADIFEGDAGFFVGFAGSGFVPAFTEFDVPARYRPGAAGV